MKIVIIGAGEIGRHLSRLLSEEKQDVIVLDRDGEALAEVAASCDVLAREGNAASARDLLAAGVKDADLVIAATSLDEVNMIASMMSKRLGANKVIARIRSDEFTNPDTPLNPEDMGIDVMIHPEQSVAQEIVQLIKRSSASDVLNLADGKMQLVGLRLEKNSPLVGMTLMEYDRGFPNLVFRIVAIYRGGRTIIPDGSDRLLGNDNIFVIARTDTIPDIVKSTGKVEQPITRIMIAGGTKVGSHVARILNKENGRWNIKLIEPSEKGANQLAAELKNILVLHGEATDPDLLAIEGVQDTDAFISVTDDEESNIISCLMAKHLGVRKTVAMVSKPQYIPLSQTIGLDAAVNKKLSASNEIHRHIRQGKVLAVSSLQGIKAELLELEVGSRSKAVGKLIHKIRFPEGCIVGGIIHNGSVEIATGQTIIRKNDRIIVFCLPQSVEAITSYFK
ncbi:MAG: Trk system potassium transporter TrkA [Balneolales bacterium]